MIRVTRRVLALVLVVSLLGMLVIAVPSPAAAITISVPYSAASVADADLDGNPATGAWSDAGTWTVPFENGASSPYGSGQMYAKHDGTTIYFRVDGKIDVPWTSATGNRFWLGMEISPTGTSHHGSGTWDGVFFGLWDGTNYGPQPTYPPSAVDTTGFSKPPAKDAAQSDLGKMGFSGTAAPYSFTAEWKRALSTGDTSGDVILKADGTTAYHFFVSTDSDGGGSNGGRIDHTSITNNNIMRLAAIGGTDTVAPTVSISAPATNSYASASVTITATAADNVGVAKVEFSADGTLLGTDTTAPYSQTWDTTTVAEGTHTVTARAVDAANNVATSNITVIVDRTAPVANAGPDASAAQGERFVFDGSGSTDARGIANHTWTFTDGSARTLYGAAPAYTFSNLGAFVVTLTAADPAGNRGTDAMTVTVMQDAQPPVARAGAAQAVAQGSVVRLDGTNSTDDAGIANYTWTFTDGSARTLWGASPAYRFGNLGSFRITLTVQDYTAKTSSAVTWVNVTADTTPPVANAGSDLQITLGQAAVLDGSNSTDNAGIVNYTWQVEGVPTALYGPVVNVTPTAEGTYQANLTVRDGAGLTSTSSLVITVVGPDRVPPGRLRAPTVHGLGAGTVLVAWEKSNAPDLAGYLVFRSNDSKGPFVQLNAAPIRNTTYVDQGLLPGVVYYYEIVAVDVSGNPSRPSPVASGVPPAADPSFDLNAFRWAFLPLGMAIALVVIASLVRREMRRRLARLPRMRTVLPPPKGGGPR